MLDEDLAFLYDVETRVLNQAVKRNIGRFPERFCFKLTPDEYELLRSQIVILKKDDALISQNVTLESRQGKHRKYLPYAFTEQGVAMLSIEFFIFFIAYLKDLGKKWFAFSKMDIGAVDMLSKLKERK